MTVFKPLILDQDGVMAMLGNGEIINAGGTSNPTFTVNGRGLLFDDGSSTNGGAGTLPSMQAIYNASPVTNPLIKLSTGKDFSIADDTDNSIYFHIDSETGKVTITGDLDVHGNTTQIDSVIQDANHWLISPKAANTIALQIEPDAGVVPFVDLFSVRKTFGSLPVVRIDSNGNLLLSQDLSITGLINGIDVVSTDNKLQQHLNAAMGFRHTAADVDVAPISTLPSAHNVQEALEQLNTKVDNISVISNVSGYEHVQLASSLTWNIYHNHGTIRAQVTIYNENHEQIIPERIKITDANSIEVNFNSPMTGRAIVFLF